MLTLNFGRLPGPLRRPTAFPNIGNFAIAADVAAMGTVIPGATPASCMLTEAPGSADVNCGMGGAIYNLAAGSDESYAGKIVLAYPQ